MVEQPAESVIGVDSGGTFTDAVVLLEDGTLSFDKAPTTTDHLPRGTIDSLANAVADLPESLPEVLERASRFAHGTTVATNALIERTGCRVGLLTTAGFEDTTTIMRDGMGKSMGVSYRSAMDYLHTERPDPLPPSELVRGVHERVDSEGTVLEPLDEASARSAIDSLLDREVDAIAVNFLWSFKHPAHERQVTSWIRERAPDVFVTRSSELAPVLGEYERSMTTVVNAYLGPTIDDYVDRLGADLRDAGLSRRLELMQCTGGLVPADEARRSAVSMINSGPVGGLVAARMLGRIAGTDDIIATDVGGTSFDVGVIHDGKFEIDRTPFVDQGTPVHVPAAEINTIGAGGGSIVWTRGNRLRVGPKSAGAHPGPVCYDRGGSKPTTTDALLALGYLNPDNFFDGRMKLDTEGSTEALADVGRRLGLTATEVALGTYEIATSKMADLLRKQTVERGHDPREFTIYAYGGAGPAHAAAYARELGAGEVVVPKAAPVFSAFGIAFADVKRTYSQTRAITLRAENSADVAAVFDALQERAAADLDGTDDDPAAFASSYSIDMRYEGQMNEISIDVDPPLDIAALLDRFDRAYDQRFGEGASLDAGTVEAITFRLTTVKPGADAPLESVEPTGGDVASADRGERTMYFPATGAVEGAVYDGQELSAGDALDGPAVIEEPGTTIVVPPASRVALDEQESAHISW